MESCRTVCERGTGEITEKKSRFIADVIPVSSEEEAFGELESVKKKYWDARHHCWAFVLAGNPGCERFSDDGEPSGTAGKPILEVIRSRGLTDVLIIVTRYFGGTLLGTGGLVRAYTSAAAEGLSRAKLITKMHGVCLHIRTDYTGLGRLQYLLAGRGLHVLDTIYTDKVEITVPVPDDGTDALCRDIMESTNGQAVIEEEGACWFAMTEQGLQIFDEQGRPGK